MKNKQIQGIRRSSIETLERRLPFAIDFGAFEHLSALTGAVQASSELGSTVAGDVSVFEGRGPSDRSGVFVSAGASAGADARVVRANETREGDQDSATIVSLSDGAFVVVWHGRGEGDRDGVFARWFDASLEPTTPELLVNQTVQGKQSEPVATILPGDQVAIAWQGFGIGRVPGVYLRRFSASGEPLSNELSAGAPIESHSSSPSIAASSAQIAVSWESESELSGSQAVLVSRLDSNGQLIQPAVSLVSDNVNGNAPSIVAQSDGNFAVAWSEKVLGQSTWQVKTQPLSASGFSASASITLSPDSTQQANVHIAVDDADRIFAAWDTLATNGTGWNLSLAKVVGQNASLSVAEAATFEQPGRQSGAGVSSLSNSTLNYAWNGSSPIDTHGVYRSTVQVDATTTGRLDLVAIPAQTIVAGNELRIPLLVAADARALEVFYRIDEDSSATSARIEQDASGRSVFVYQPTASTASGEADFTIVVTNVLGEVDQEVIRVTIIAA